MTALQAIGPDGMPVVPSIDPKDLPDRVMAAYAKLARLGIKPCFGSYYNQHSNGDSCCGLTAIVLADRVDRFEMGAYLRSLGMHSDMQLEFTDGFDGLHGRSGSVYYRAGRECRKRLVEQGLIVLRPWEMV